MKRSIDEALEVTEKSVRYRKSVRETTEVSTKKTAWWEKVALVMGLATVVLELAYAVLQYFL